MEPGQAELRPTIQTLIRLHFLAGKIQVFCRDWRFVLGVGNSRNLTICQVTFADFVS